MRVITVGPNAPAPYTTNGDNDQVQINAAITASSAGDAVFLDHSVFVTSGTLLEREDVDVYGRGKFVTQIIADGFPGSGAYMYQGVSVNTCRLRKLTLNGNWQGGGGTQLGGIFLAKSSGHLLEDLNIIETDGPKISYASVTNSTANNIRTRNTKGATGISHGVDIDHATDVLTDCDGLTFNDCDLEDADRDATKVENGVNIVFNRSRFGSRTLLGEAVASNVGVIFNDCIHDARVIIAARNAGAPIELNRSKFTHDGGVLQIESNAGAEVHLTDPQFYGRNTYYGWNGVTWMAVTCVTVFGALRHYNPAGNGGKTVFGDPKNTHHDVGVLPHTTPNMASTNFEALVENTNLDETNMNYALMGGSYVWNGGLGATQVQAGTGLTVESYDHYGTRGRAIIDLDGQAFDFINFGSGGRVIGGVLKGFHIKNGVGNFNGTGISIVGTGIGTETSVRLVDVEVSDMVGSAGSYGQAVYISGDGWNVTLENFYAHDIVAGSSGGAIRAQNAGVLTMKGYRQHDINSVGGALRITSTVTSYDLSGIETVRCDGGGGTAGLLLENPGTVSQALFKDNVGADIASGANAVTLNNSILPDYNNWTGTAKTANYCLFGANSPGGTNIAGVPIFENAANDDYRLTDASPGRKAGNLWWSPSGPRPIGVDGLPFPDDKIDIGSRQRIANS